MCIVRLSGGYQHAKPDGCGLKSFWKTANITVFANSANVSSTDGRDHKTAHITAFVGSENVSSTACHDYKTITQSLKSTDLLNLVNWNL